ncbi:Bromodomain adjacent to zinc finger domain protein 2B [Manis javanica]|nr:Bromodomain adjacent to zinc finger domain protein 2B [Manis javanica]
MVTHLSEELRKGKMEKNTCGDWSKLPTFSSVKTPKRDESKDLTICSMNLNEMETHLNKEQRKGTMEENDSGHLSKQPSCTSVKKPKQTESLYLANCCFVFAEMPNREEADTNLNEMETHLSKDQRKRKMEESTSGNSSEPSFTCVKKVKRDDCKDLSLCSMILTEIENHEDAWPFRLPVNLNFVSGYTKVIKKPMDFSTIREKLISGQYPNLEAFAVDVRLVFDNCEAFNQDESDTRRSDHSMGKYFEKKWTDTLKVSRSYNNLSFFLFNKDK